MGVESNMVAPKRIQYLLQWIEAEEHRLDSVVQHPVFVSHVQQEPKMLETLSGMRSFWGIFRRDARQNDLFIEQYIDQLEQVTEKVSLEMDRLFEVLGLNTRAQTRALN